MLHEMGHTLVLPPDQQFYLLRKNNHKQKIEFNFGNFFHLELIATKHKGFNVIFLKEFLHCLGTTGKLVKMNTRKPKVWDKKGQYSLKNMRIYFRKVVTNPYCYLVDYISAFPFDKRPKTAEEL